MSLLHEIVRQKRRMSVLVTGAQIANATPKQAEDLARAVVEEERKTAELSERLMTQKTGAACESICEEGHDHEHHDEEQEKRKIEIVGEDPDEIAAKAYGKELGMSDEDIAAAIKTFRHFDESGDCMLQRDEIKLMLITCTNSRLRPFEAETIAKLKVSQQWASCAGNVSLKEFMKLFINLKSEVEDFDPSLATNVDQVREARFIAEGGEAADVPDNEIGFLRHVAAVPKDDGGVEHHDHDCAALGHDPLEYMSRKRIVHKVIGIGAEPPSFDVMECLMLTHPRFMTSLQLLLLLVTEYKEHTSSSDAKEKMAGVRIFNFLKHWVSAYFHVDFGPSEEMAEQLKQFLLTSGNETMNQTLIKAISKAATTDIPDVIPDSTDTKIIDLELRDLTPVKAAQELCLQDFSLFRTMSTRDLLLAGTSEDVETANEVVGKVVAHFQRQVQMFAGEVFSKTDSSEKRAKVIGKLLNIGMECKKRNNFSAVAAIVQALRSEPVARLKVTWGRVTKDKMGKWKQLSALVSEADVFNNYFKEWRGAAAPRVPYLIAHMVKLSEVGDEIGNVHDKTEFDYRPFLKASKIVKETIENNRNYDFKVDPLARNVIQFKMGKAPALKVLEAHSKRVEVYIQ